MAAMEIMHWLNVWRCGKRVEGDEKKKEEGKRGEGRGRGADVKC